MALEELGTTFIKLGQILSTRPDLLPPDYQAELARLQDGAPLEPFEAINAVLVGELGQPVSEAFATFDTAPLAAASIGQVYAATLADGTEVVVKVRRPGALEQVEEDLEILQNLAAAATRRWEFAQYYDLVGLAEEFAQTLRAELDYLREGRNAERFAANFADEAIVHIPRVFWDITTSRVLTLERIRGIKINDLPALEQAGIERKDVAERSARILLKMVFEDGFFHADPHPGNFFVEAGGRIGLIDFGMVGTVDERTQDQLVRLLVAIAGQDPEELVDAFLELGVARGRADRTILRQDLEHLLSRYYGRPLGEIAVAPLLADALAVVRHHYLHLPPNLALLIKTVIMSEGLGTQLDPTFNMATVLAPLRSGWWRGSTRSHGSREGSVEQVSRRRVSRWSYRSSCVDCWATSSVALSKSACGRRASSRSSTASSGLPIASCWASSRRRSSSGSRCSCPSITHRGGSAGAGSSSLSASCSPPLSAPFSCGASWVRDAAKPTLSEVHAANNPS